MFPTIKLNIERWKYNPTFELYVSNMGHIRNKSKADIAPKIMQNGYVVVYVYGSLNKYMLLHRVVMLTWKPTPEAEMLTVDHLDHNKRNNALSNLEWVTEEENIRRAKEDYIVNSSLVGNDVIVTETKKEPTKKALAASNITGVKVQKDGTSDVLTVFHRKYDEEVINFCGPLEGKINNFSTKRVRNILKEIYSGKNCVGYRKYCNFEFIAIREEE